MAKWRQQFAMNGGDAEIGVHITQSTKYDVYLGAGPYHLSSERPQSWGGKVRLLGRYKEYISLEGSYSYDHLFKNIVQGSISFNYPFGGKMKRKWTHCKQKEGTCNVGTDLMLSRASFSPYRSEIPVIKKVRRTGKAINPATGQPWTVWFVNNTSSSAGTFKSPFPTLAEAQNASNPNDMIYVFPGDGTSNGMNQGIILQDGQLLFGSGMTHRIRTKEKSIIIPAYSTTEPLVTHDTSNVVILANGNEVAGLRVNVGLSGGTGFLGSAIKGTWLHDNVVTTAVSGAGVNIAGNSGAFKIANNQFICSTVLSPATFSRAISFSVNDNNFVDLTISNNQISGYNTGVLITPNIGGSLTAAADILISQNMISNYQNNGVILSLGLQNSNLQSIK